MTMAAGCHFCIELAKLPNDENYDDAAIELFDRADRAARVRRLYGTRKRRNRRNLT